MNFFSTDVLSMMVVGALWGCTNPLLRKGSVEANSTATSTKKKAGKSTSVLATFLKSFMDVKVWLPYVLNQSGSLAFYVLLANSNISTAVPICNAMALLFSFLMSSFLGEPIQNLPKTALGAFFILAGVTICVSSQEEPETITTAITE